MQGPKKEKEMSAPVARNLRALFQELGKGTKGLWPLLILVAFNFVGALIFRELESPNEVFTLKTEQEQREKILEDTVFRLNNIRAMKPAAAFNHTVRTLKIFQDKLGVEPIDVQKQQKWTFWGAMFYACTVYTTIGYGSIYPVTAGGRIFTILYSFIGIPLTLICLYYLGLTFARICKFFWRLMLKGCGCLSKDLERKVSKAVGVEEGEAKATEEDETNELLSFPISFLAFLTVLWILMCAAIWAWTEDWDYGTSLYFTLISFTTIGFGDITPNTDGFILFAFLLFIGLALVSTVLNLIQQQIEALATGMQDNIDREYMNALAEAADEGEISEADMRRMSEAQVVEGEEMTQSHVEESNKRALDAVIARMPLKERLLFKVMPAASRKQLEASAQQKANRKNKACQTDNTLLENLIKEEILKMELNNELERRKPKSGMESPFLLKRPSVEENLAKPPPTTTTTTFAAPGPSTVQIQYQNEGSSKETTPEAPIRPHRGFKIEKVTEVGHEEEKPLISTTVLQEDDV